MRTNVDGLYSIKALSPDPYIVYAGFQRHRHNWHWMVRADLPAGATTLDLTNSNKGWVFEHDVKALGL